MADDIFPMKQIFAVIYEAQMAAMYLRDSFCSFTTGIDIGPVLHVFYRFLWTTNIFEGAILAGTALSMKMVWEPQSAQVTK